MKPWDAIGAVSRRVAQREPGIVQVALDARDLHSGVRSLYVEELRRALGDGYGVVQYEALIYVGQK